MYVRRSQLLPSRTLGETAFATAPAPVLAPSSQADRTNADRAAISASSSFRPGGLVYYRAPTSAPVTVSPTISAQQRAQAAAAAKTYTQSIAPVRETSISFYDESRRKQVEQLNTSNGVFDQNTPDVYAVENESLPHANDFTPYESSSSGDRAIVSAGVNSETKTTVAASLIPIAIALWLTFGV